MIGFSISSIYSGPSSARAKTYSHKQLISLAHSSILSRPALSWFWQAHCYSSILSGIDSSRPSSSTWKRYGTWSMRCILQTQCFPTFRSLFTLQEFFSGSLHPMRHWTLSISWGKKIKTRKDICKKLERSTNYGKGGEYLKIYIICLLFLETTFFFLLLATFILLLLSVFGLVLGGQRTDFIKDNGSWKVSAPIWSRKKTQYPQSQFRLS